MRATLLFSLLLGIASTHTAGQRATRSPIGQDLRSSDFGRAFAEQNLRGHIQVADSKIFVFDSSAPRIFAYGPEGQFLGSLRLPDPRRRARLVPHWHSKGRRDHLVVDGEQVYVSWGGRIVRWDVGLGGIAEVIEFDRPVRLLKALDDGLILEDPDLEMMFSVVDRQGQLLFRFGKPLVAAKNSSNDQANRFLAFHRDGFIQVLFLYYPIYRVYDLDGGLVEEGRYETPDGPWLSNMNPALEELAQMEETPESWHPEIMQAKQGPDGLHVYFNGFTFGVLDSSFRLVFRRDLLDDPTFAVSPRVFDIDTENRRLLVFNGHDDHPQFRFVSVAPTP